jgi:hypothetical protein
MKHPRVLSAAEQLGQAEEKRMKQREPGQGEQHEADRRDPVVDPRPPGVTVDRDRASRMDCIA